jgi:hypothetical protein
MVLHPYTGAHSRFSIMFLCIQQMKENENEEDKKEDGKLLLQSRNIRLNIIFSLWADSLFFILIR